MSKIWKAPWGAKYKVMSALEVLQAAIRRLEEVLEARWNLAWEKALEDIEGEEVWGQNPHARELALHPIFRAFLWVVGVENPTTWKEVREGLGTSLDRLWVLLEGGGTMPDLQWWQAVSYRLRHLLEAMKEGPRWLLPKGWPSSWPRLAEFRSWARAVADFLLARGGLELTLSKAALARVLEALLEELDQRELNSLQARVERSLLADTAYQAARDALAALEEAERRKSFSPQATAALGMAAALGKSSSVATTAEMMSRGAEAALEAAARWKRGGLPFAFWVFVHAEHRVGEWLARQRGWGTEASVLPLDALLTEEGELYEEFLPTTTLQDNRFWEEAVQGVLRLAGLTEAEVHILLLWASEGDEALEALFGPGLREAWRKWLRTTLKQLRGNATLRELWEDLD